MRYTKLTQFFEMPDGKVRMLANLLEEQQAYFLADLPVERYYVVIMDSDGKDLKRVEIGQGSATTCIKRGWLRKVIYPTGYNKAPDHV